MIRLQPGVNDVVLTLTERTTIDNPVYLFEFEHVQTQQKYTCITADTSQYKYRYNEFSLTVGTGDPLVGFINLVTDGDYYYRIFAQSSTTNLDPEQAFEKVEQGYMTYTTTANNPEQYNGASSERRAYQQ